VPLAQYSWAADAPGDTDKAKALRLVRRCEQACRENDERVLRAALYGSVFEGLTFTTGAVAAVSAERLAPLQAEQTPIYRNLVRSAVQSEIARVMAVQELLPQLMSSGGDFRQQQSAVELTRWLEVLFQSPHGVFDSLADMQRHGAILEYAATGSVALFPEVDRWGGIVMALDDTLTMGFDGSGLYHMPRRLVRTREYDPEDLLELHPEHEEAIMRAVESGQRFLPGDDGPRACPVVRVAQGWQLRRGDIDGIRMFALKDGTILDNREYTSDKLPCALSHYERSLKSRFGVPLSQVIWNNQRDSNESLADWSAGIRSTSGVICEYEDGSLVNEGALPRNKAVKYVKRQTNSAPIRWTVPPKGNPESPQFADYLHAAALEQLGLSDSTISGNRTEGVTSGRHQHLTSGIQTERLAEHSRRKNKWRAVESARVLLMAGVEAREQDETIKFQWRKETEAQELALSRLDLEGADAMVLTIAEVDAEKDSPKMRLERIEQWVAAGMATPADLITAEQNYDAKALSAEALTVQRWADLQVSRWLNASEDDLADPAELIETPDPYLGPDLLQTMLRRVAVAHTDARMRGVPDERLALFRTFLERVSVLAQRAMVDPTNAPAPAALGELDPAAALGGPGGPAPPGLGPGMPAPALGPAAPGVAA